MSEQHELITIAITCYNAQDTILRAIQSAMKQTYPRFEILVVDDASTDNSAAIIQQFITHNPLDNLRLLINDRNSGPGYSRQRLLQAAQGKWIVFFDDDDISFPERLWRQQERILAYEGMADTTLIACYASGKRQYPNGYIKVLKAIGPLDHQAPQGTEIVNYHFFNQRNPARFYGSGTPSCSLMARKSTFEQVGGFDADFRRVEDVDFAIRLGLYGGVCVGTQEMLFLQHATTGSDKQPENNLKAELQLADKYQTYLRSVNRYYYASHWPKLRYWHFKGHYLNFTREFLALWLRHPLPVTKHLLSTGPARLLHEFKMNKQV